MPARRSISDCGSSRRTLKSLCIFYINFPGSLRSAISISSRSRLITLILILFRTSCFSFQPSQTSIRQIGSTYSIFRILPSQSERISLEEAQSVQAELQQLRYKKMEDALAIMIGLSAINGSVVSCLSMAETSVWREWKLQSRRSVLRSAQPMKLCRCFKLISLPQDQYVDMSFRQRQKFPM